MKLCRKLPLRLPQLQNKNLLKAVALMAVCVPIGMAIPKYLTVSISSSLGDHVFIMRGLSEYRPKQGDLVRYPHNDAVTGNKQVYMLKRVECVAGQRLSVDKAKEYWCDGRYIGRAKDRSKQGVPVQNFVYDGIVPEGKFFALAPHIDSYDSRYYGLVDSTSVVATAYALF